MPLAHSFWVNVVGLNVFFRISLEVFTLLTSSESNNYHNPWLNFVWLTVLLLLALFAYLWQIIGCWRSANNHINNSGKYYWARISQFWLVFILANLSPAFYSIATYMHFTYAHAAKISDYSQYVIKSTGATDLTLIGSINYYSVEEIRRSLNNQPEIKSITLESKGGYLDSARELKRIIQARSLNTYTRFLCASGCTIAFLGGNTRVMEKDAKLGFHSFLYPYSQRLLTTYNADKKEMAEFVIAEIKKDYGLDQLPEWFIQHILTTESTNMWYPSMDELIEAKVVTAVYDIETKNISP